MSSLAVDVAEAIVTYLNDPQTPQTVFGDDWKIAFQAEREWIHRVDRAIGTDVEVFVTPGSLMRAPTSRTRGRKTTPADTIILVRTWVRQKVSGAGAVYDKQTVDDLVELTEQIYIAQEAVSFAGAALTTVTVDDNEQALYDPETLEKQGIFLAQLDQQYKKV